MASQFSEDGKYFAQICSDGKLKIWNTMSNSFEQEFTPDFHLNTPCTCLHFLPQYHNTVNKGSPSPKKKRRKTDQSIAPNIVLGTTSGFLLVYYLAKASVGYKVESNTNLQINCLSSDDGNLVYAGADQNILIWNLQNKNLVAKWKGGNEIISSILAVPDKETLVTASKIIKLWNVKSKEVLRTFTGHKSDIISMKYICPLGSDSYLLCGSKGDRLLSCWNITNSAQKTAVCNYLMEDNIQHLSVNICEDGLTSVATIVRSGVVHIYQHRLNGKCDKPLKPKTTIQIACNSEKQNKVVVPIKIFGGVFRDSESICLGHGSEMTLTFENVNFSNLKKVHYLVREAPKTAQTLTEDEVIKKKTPLVDDDVHYTSSHVVPSPAKRKPEGDREIPMEQRLENLTLNTVEGKSKLPRVDNVAHLLLQGLHSKDRNLLRTAICKKDENIIRNTVKRLPVTVFEGLIKELTLLLQGKTMMSHFAALWLKHLAQVHAGLLISNPNLSEMFSGALGSINSRLSLQNPLNRLKGKLELLVPHVNTTKNNVEGDDEASLVFIDQDSNDSESEEEMQIEIASDSEPEKWEESDNDQENNVELESDAGSDSDSVVMVQDNSGESD